MLDRLVVTNRAAEDTAPLRIANGLCKRGATQTNRLRGNQDPLRIHAVQNELEASALLADAVLDRHRQAVDEKLVGVDRLASHLLNFAYVDVAPVEVGVEQAQAFGAFCDPVGRRGA